MATRRNGKSKGGAASPRGRASSGAGRLVLAFLLGAALVGVAGYFYLHPGSLPFTGRQPAPDSPRPETHTPAPTKPTPHPTPPRRSPPFGTSEDVFEAGAHIYGRRCAGCHGTPLRVGTSGTHVAPQLWRRDPATGKVGVTARPPGEIYESISAGTPTHGMPAYARLLTETEIWQVTLLLKNAGEDLPDPVTRIVNGSLR